MSGSCRYSHTEARSGFGSANSVRVFIHVYSQYMYTWVCMQQQSPKVKTCVFISRHHKPGLTPTPTAADSEQRCQFGPGQRARRGAESELQPPPVHLMVQSFLTIRAPSMGGGGSDPQPALGHLHPLFHLLPHHEYYILGSEGS